MNSKEFQKFCASLSISKSAGEKKKFCDSITPKQAKEFYEYCGSICSKSDEDIHRYCDTIPPTQAVNFLRQELKDALKKEYWSATATRTPQSKQFRASLWWSPNYKHKSEFLEAELRFRRGFIASRRRLGDDGLETDSNRIDRKPKPGIENKTFIYADVFQLKANEYCISRPGIVRKALGYTKDKTQFRRDLHNSKFVKYPIFEIRNRQNEKSTAKMAIKRTSDKFSDNNRLIDKISDIAAIERTKKET